MIGAVGNGSGKVIGGNVDSMTMEKRDITASIKARGSFTLLSENMDETVSGVKEVHNQLRARSRRVKGLPKSTTSAILIDRFPLPNRLSGFRLVGAKLSNLWDGNLPFCPIYGT